MKYLIFSLFIILISCEVDKDKPKSTLYKKELPTLSNPIFYKDFDIFKMQGIDELHGDSLTYPYIAVNKNQDSLTMIIYKSCHKNESITYYHKDGYWEKEVIYNNDIIEEGPIGEEMEIFYQFIYEDSILTYGYFIDEDGTLSEGVSIDVAIKDSLQSYEYLSSFEKIGEQVDLTEAFLYREDTSSRDSDDYNSYSLNSRELTDTTLISCSYNYSSGRHPDDNQYYERTYYFCYEINFTKPGRILNNCKEKYELPKGFSYFWLIYLNEWDLFEFRKTVDEKWEFE